MDNNQNNLATFVSGLPLPEAKKQELIWKLGNDEAAAKAELKTMLADLGVRLAQANKDMQAADKEFKRELLVIEEQAEKLASDVAKGRADQDLEKIRTQLA